MKTLFYFLPLLLLFSCNSETSKKQFIYLDPAIEMEIEDYEEIYQIFFALRANKVELTIIPSPTYDEYECLSLEVKKSRRLEKMEKQAFLFASRKLVQKTWNALADPDYFSGISFVLEDEISQKYWFPYDDLDDGEIGEEIGVDIVEYEYFDEDK
ncbi:MAG: hypothetical protein AAFY71_14170 [Bacteroidota bacterium]